MNLNETLTFPWTFYINGLNFDDLGSFKSLMNKKNSVNSMAYFAIKCRPQLGYVTGFIAVTEKNMGARLAIDISLNIWVTCIIKYETRESWFVIGINNPLYNKTDINRKECSQTVQAAV